MSSESATDLFKTSDHDLIDPCIGHEEQLNNIMARLFGSDRAPLSTEERERLEGHADRLNQELDERNRRLDGSYFNWTR